jgi:hypothetical protein
MFRAMFSPIELELNSHELELNIVQFQLIDDTSRQQLW